MHIVVDNSSTQKAPDGRQAAADRLRSVDDLGAAVRVHGDYYLGQLLRADEGWFVLAFEGEPARPTGERPHGRRRSRTWAGVIRSLDDAKSWLSRVVTPASVRPWLPWGRRGLTTICRALLYGYLGTEGIAELLPVGEDERWAVLDTVEVDKAVYGVLHEREYGPDQVAIRQAARRLIDG